MTDVSVPRGARPSPELQATFRIRCEGCGCDRFMIAGGDDLEALEAFRPISVYCWNCGEDRQYVRIAPPRGFDEGGSE